MSAKEMFNALGYYEKDILIFFATKRTLVFKMFRII